MPAMRIRSQFDQLDQIARQFAAEAAKTGRTTANLRNKVDVLRAGDWLGHGADKFYAEMDEVIFPSMKRLTQALQASEKTTLKLSAIFHQAEEDTAAIFRSGAAKIGVGQGGDGSGSGSGGPGGIGGSGDGSGPGSSGGPGGSGGPSGSGGPNKWVKGKGKGFEWGKQDGQKYGKPSFGIKYGVAKGAVFGDAKAADGVSAIGGEAGVEFNIESLKKGKVGIFGEGYLAKAQGDTILAGDRDLGLTAAGEVKAGGVSAFAGVKDYTVGASVGGSLISAKGEIGANIAGYNVGVNAEVGLKAELGFQIGKKTAIKLPFITLGFNFGGARD